MSAEPAPDLMAALRASLELYVEHKLCTCGHFLASHMPIENNARGACYDPASACTCRTYDAKLPWRTK